MPAFTQLCKKVNISIFNDTITVYPKPVPGVFSFIYTEFDPDVLALFGEHLDELKNKDYVHREDKGHDQYHKDSFSMDDTHMHMRYSKDIDELLLASVLQVFVKYNVITQQEEKSFLDAFHDIGVDLLLLNHLDLIKEKADAFKTLAEKNDKYVAPRDAANALCKEINDAMAQYKATPKSKANYDQFQKTCSEAIGRAKPILENHRGWKRVLGNLGLAIAGLGVLYVVAGLVNLKMNNSFLFFNKTDSAKRLDKVEQMVRNHPAPAA